MSTHEPKDLEATRQLSRHELDRMVAGARRTFGYIGPYQLTEVLGRGGSSIVFRARKSQGSDVALKVFNMVPGTKATELKRFLREGEVGSHLRSHPNIITIYDTGQDGSSYYIAMELVPGGRTLKDLVTEQGALDRDTALGLAIPIADALVYAHREGFVHRDIKPGNVLLSRFGQPLLTDFGLVHADDSNITAAGEVLGTPVFMAPEELSANTVVASPQTDIYSFGILLHYMLTGQLPFKIDQTMPLNQMLSIVQTTPPTMPADHGKQVGTDLERVLTKLLQKDPANRYRTMADVLADLQACRGGRPLAADAITPEPVPAAGWRRWASQHAMLSLTLAAAALAMVAVALALAAQWRRRQAPVVPTNTDRKSVV
jgi:eukaryotic-like serine/threonine-protein kinase